MNIKSILMIAAAALVGFSAQAQEQKGPLTPVRFGVSVTAGASSYASVNALPGMLTSYEASALSVDWTDKALTLGFEGSMIFCDRWKLDLGGAYGYYVNPARYGVPGTMGAEYEIGEIPTYQSVDKQKNLNWQAYVAGSYYFRIKNVPALRPYAGVRAQFSYASQLVATDNYMAMGASVAETYALYAGIMTGVDYYFSRNFYVGAVVEPFRYTYGVTLYRPQEGLAVLGADTHFFSAFAAPRIKIGFLF